MTIRIEEVLFVIGLVALIYQWRLNVLSKRKKDKEKEEKEEKEEQT